MGVKCAISRPRPAARGFFNLFYRWNTGACQARAGFRTASETARRRETKGTEETITSPFIQALEYFQPQLREPIRQPSRPSSTPIPRSKAAEPALSTTLRGLMRTLPHSVVVLTTSTYLSSSRTIKLSTKENHKAMTLSSFTTLTLTPSPIITFNIRHPSQTLSAIRHSRSFLIHMLNATPQGAKVADTFTKGNKGSVWDGLDVVEVGGGLPRIRNEGVGKVLACEVLEGEKGFVTVGDHVVVIAGVKEIMEGQRKEEQGALGLSYVDGRYRGVGDVIDVHGEGMRRGDAE